MKHLQLDAAEYDLLMDTMRRLTAGRSTPEEIGDCKIVRDRRGKEWKYSEPSDTWCLVTGDLGPGSVALSSARSWQRLVADFGPLA